MNGSDRRSHLINMKLAHFLGFSGIYEIASNLVQACRRSGARRDARDRSAGCFRKVRRARLRSYHPLNSPLPANPRTCQEGPFGEVIRATGLIAKANPFRFSTKYQDDETDLLYYGYRYYTASTGRWLSRDPIGERGGIHLYEFALNDAQNAFDNLGLVKCACTAHPNTPADQLKDPNGYVPWGMTKCAITAPKVSVKECCSSGALWWKEYKFKLIVEAPGRCVCDIYYLAGIDPDRRKGRSGRSVRQHEAAHVQNAENYANALERLYDSLKNRCVTKQCITAMNTYIAKADYWFLATMETADDQLEYRDYPLDYPGLEDKNTFVSPGVREEAFEAYTGMLKACGWN